VPKGNSGKIITKISINKKDVSLYFSKERISISHDAYVIMPLYVGKVLSNKDIKLLNDTTMNAKLLNYAMGLLMKKHYSEYAMREKLYTKEASKEQVDFVINKLKSVDLIDDKAFVYDYLCYAKEKNIGKYKILKELENKGVFAENLEKISFPEHEERRKARERLKSLENRYSKLPFEKKKQKIYQHLLTDGFDSSICMDVLSQIKDNNVKEENKMLKDDYNKLSLKLSKRYEGKELYDRIYKSLKNKGYRYKDILKVMEDNNYAN